MKRLIITAVMVIMMFPLAGSALAHNGNHGPCTGGAPAAVVAFGMPVSPGAEFGATISTLASDALNVVSAIHEQFCAANSPGNS